MIEKMKNNIMHSAEENVLKIDQKDIEEYLSEVKEAVEKDNYRLDRNARRRDNISRSLGSGNRRFYKHYKVLIKVSLIVV